MTAGTTNRRPGRADAGLLEETLEREHLLGARRASVALEKAQRAPVRGRPAHGLDSGLPTPGKLVVVKTGGQRSEAR